MISVVLCKISQPSRYNRKSYDGKFVTAKCSSINYGATLNNLPCIYLKTHYLIHLFSQWNKTKFTIICRWLDYFIKIQNYSIGLQNCFEKHTSFILRNMDVMLKINPKKTNIMIFRKRPRKSVDNNFKTGNEHTEIVEQFTYLGTRLTHSPLNRP